MSSASENGSPGFQIDVQDTRLGELLSALAKFGARSDGGVNRPAFSDEDLAARRFLVDIARQYGAEASRDAIGNMFFRRPGTDVGLDPVVTGSHADSQPTGGKLDGAYGVCAGFEMLAALYEGSFVHRRPIDVVVWANEEGCRFAPGSMGSTAFVDQDRLEEMLESTDAEGISVRQEMIRLEAMFEDVPLRSLGTPMHAFVEAHIEQGPVLESAGRTIGVVRGIQGTRWFQIEVQGVAAHAGSTPRAARIDALRAASALANDIYEIFDAGDELLRMTIGRVTVHPGAVNVIPERVVMTVDVRHPLESTLDEVEARLRGRAALLGDRVAVALTMALQPTPFDRRVRAAIQTAADDLQLSSMDIDSGAFHDSLNLARHCPTGMVFVPSVEGLSHNPREETDLSDLAAGVRVLARAILELAGD